MDVSILHQGFKDWILEITFSRIDTLPYLLLTEIYLPHG